MRTATAAAGWYADPTGEAAQRFWDGDRWTERVRHPPLDEAPPPVGVKAVTSREETSDEDEQNALKVAPARWNPLKRWRWWLALLVAVPMAWFHAVSQYFGSVPALHDDYYLAAFTIDLLVAFAYSLLVYVGIPSLVAKVVSRWRQDPRQDPTDNDPNKPRKRLAAFAALIALLLAPILPLRAAQRGTSAEMATCERAQAFADASAATMSSKTASEFNARMGAAEREVRALVTVARTTRNTALTSAAIQTQSSFEQIHNDLSHGDTSAVRSHAAKADEAMTKVATICEQLGKRLRY